MLKISLYQHFCEYLCVISINTYDYRKNQSYTTDRQAMSAEYRRDSVANPQGQMAQTCGLFFHRFLALRNQSCLGSYWI